MQRRKLPILQTHVVTMTKGGVQTCFHRLSWMVRLNMPQEDFSFQNIPSTPKLLCPHFCVCGCNVALENVVK